MRKFLFAVLVLSLNACGDKASNPASPPADPAHERLNYQDLKLLEGDLIFQKSTGFAGEVFRELSGSAWTHVGVLQDVAGKWYVAEAYKPVGLTAIDKFLVRGENGDFIVARVKASLVDLSQDANQRKFKKSLHGYFAKQYDTFFAWSDERMYCSELVWKAFRDAFALQLGPLQRLRDFNLTGPLATQLIAEYKASGGEINYDETVVSPQSLLESSYVDIVYRSY